MARQHNWWKWLSVFLIFCGVIGAIVLWQYLGAPTAKSPLSESQRSALTFSPFVIIPGENSRVSGERYEITNTEDGTQMLTFIVRLGDKTATVSEYVQPQQFNDIPEYKDRFLSNVISQQSTIQTANGTVYIGRQTQNNNKPVGVLLERGLILFIAPDQSFDDTDWRTTTEALEITKNNLG